MKFAAATMTWPLSPPAAAATADAEAADAEAADAEAADAEAADAEAADAEAADAEAAAEGLGPSLLDAGTEGPFRESGNWFLLKFAPGSSSFRFSCSC